MPAPVEIVRLQQAISAFRDRAPQDLPEGVMSGLDEIENMLGEYAPAETSPGHRAAQSAQGLAPGTDGTGEHYRKAAKGPDGPSPGQKEATRLSEEMFKAAEELKEHITANE